VSGSFPALDNEFALTAKSAAKAGIGQDAVPRVHRSGVNVPTGGHVSAVVSGHPGREICSLITNLTADTVADLFAKAVQE
jgi:hypothetical protein